MNKVGKKGCIVLPNELREKKEIEEKTRIIIRERNGEIILTPVKIYPKPTSSLLCSVKVPHPIDKPKQLAHEHAAKNA